MDKATFTVSGPAPVSAQILLIDDDEKLSRLLANYLAQYGYELTTVYNGLAGLERFASGTWNLVILDVMLPGLDGLEVLKKIRAMSTVPVLMLSARGEEPDRILGLEIGADDYVPKAFSSRELIARIRSLLRRAAQPPAPPAAPVERPMHFTIGELTIDVEARRVLMAGLDVTLTALEFNLLVCLARANGKVLTRDQLLQEVRDKKHLLQDRSIDVHISSLRKKLGEGRRERLNYIRTVRTIGYKLVDPSEEPPPDRRRLLAADYGQCGGHV